MEKLDQSSSLFWIIVSVAVVYGSFRLDLGSLAKPGPGFFPFCCGMILGGLSALVFFRGKLTQKSGNDGQYRQLWAGTNWHKPIYVIAAILAYAMFFSHLGFLLSTSILFLFLLKGIEPERWVPAIVWAVLVSSFSYILFAVWLQVQLPRGFLEALLF